MRLTISATVARAREQRERARALAVSGIQAARSRLGHAILGSRPASTGFTEELAGLRRLREYLAGPVVWADGPGRMGSHSGSHVWTLSDLSDAYRSVSLMGGRLLMLKNSRVPDKTERQYKREFLHEVNKIQQALNFRFRDPLWLAHAFSLADQARGYNGVFGPELPNNCTCRWLARFGDALLKNVQSLTSIARSPDSKRVETNAYLGQRMRSLGLAKHVRRFSAKNVCKANRSQLSDHDLGTVAEALLAVAYLDSGHGGVDRVARALVGHGAPT